MRARSGAIVVVVGLTTGLMGCAGGDEAYCQAVREYGSLSDVDASDDMRERLEEIVDVAPADVRPLWEDFLAGIEELAKADVDLEEVDELSAELAATSERIRKDVGERCAG